MTIPWSCDFTLPHLTGLLWGFAVGVGVTLLWCRFKRNGGLIFWYTTRNSPTVGEEEE